MSEAMSDRMRALLEQAITESGPSATPEVVGARDESGDVDLIAEFAWVGSDLDRLFNQEHRN
jgi:hypothetical protein